MGEHFVTLKVPPDVRHLLRRAAASTGERQYQALRRLLTAEAVRLGLRAGGPVPSGAGRANGRGA